MRSPRSSAGIACFAVSIGIAKPTPLFERAPLGPVSICALMPMTLPVASSSGPPELPGLIAASVCRAPEIWKPFGAVMGRPSAEMTPVVSEPCRPNGEPIAIAGWPTLHVGRRAERERLQAALDVGRIDLDDREVGGRVGARDLGVDELLRLADAHAHPRRVLHDVLVREDEAAAVEHEARARALLRRPRRRRCAARPARRRRRRGPSGRGRTRRSRCAPASAPGRRAPTDTVVVAPCSRGGVLVVERAGEREGRERDRDDARAEQRAEEMAAGTRGHGTEVGRPRSTLGKGEPARSLSAWPRESAARSRRSSGPTIRGGSRTRGSRSTARTPRRTSRASRSSARRASSRSRAGRTRTCTARRPWTMRQYAGYASAEESNERYKYLLAHGSTGLSMAFDLPTQLGLDSDDPRSLGEVGRTGVAIDTIEDMRTAFDGIPLDEVSTSMTINAPAAVPAAALPARRRGAGRRRGASCAARPRTTCSRSTSPAGTTSTRRSRRCG